MTELGERIRRANLVPDESNLDQLYSSDLSTLLLTDIRAKKEGRMTELSEKKDQLPSREGIESQPAPRSPRGRHRLRLAATVTAFLTVAAAGILISLLTRGEPVATDPLGVAERFVEARTAGDAETLMSLLADDVIIGTEWPGLPETVAEYASLVELEQAIGWTRHFEPCTLVPGGDNRLRCNYALETDLTRALDLGTFGLNTVMLTVEDGRISFVDDNFAFDANGWAEEVWTPFYEWILANHPDDLETMMTGTTLIRSRLTPESIDLWATRFAEYAEYANGSG